MEFITSNQGGVKLIYDGFVHVKSKMLKSGDVSYECETRHNSMQCKARLCVSGDSIVEYVAVTTLMLLILVSEALKIRQSLTQRAVDIEETPQQVVNQELSDVDSSAAKHPAICIIHWCYVNIVRLLETSQPTLDPYRSGAPRGVNSHTCRWTISVILTVVLWKIESSSSPLSWHHVASW